jgi:hypothetical protein
MRPNDTGANLSHHGANPCLDHIAVDPEPLASPSDFVEPHAASWESAWIDLGGEG